MQQYYLFFLGAVIATCVMASPENKNTTPTPYNAIHTLVFKPNTYTSLKYPQITTNSYWNMDILCKNINYGNNGNTQPKWHCATPAGKIIEDPKIECKAVD